MSISVPVADCSPDEKLSFLSDIINNEGRVNLSVLHTVFPMRYSQYPETGFCNLDESNCLLSLCKFFINGLLAFDTAFERVFSFKGHVYILGDNTAKNIASTCQQEPALLANYGTPVFLDLILRVGIIYRFNTAHKFGYPSRGSNQLRLNGWGRKYATDWRVHASLPNSQDVEKISCIVEKYREEYRELLSLCSSHSRPLNVDRIHEINSALPFTVVT